MMPLLIVVGLLLLAVPGFVSIRGVHPAHWARYALASLLMGFAIVELGLLLWSAPVFLQMMGATDLARICRLLFGWLAPGGQLASAAAGSIALGLAAAALRGARLVRSAQRRMRVEPWLGNHHHLRDHLLVVLRTDELVAYTVGGRPPQVVISEGMFNAVGIEGADVVWAHEAVHARRRHHLFLVALGAITSAFGWYPLAMRASSITRLALERWADEEASQVTDGGRDGVRRALLTVTSTLLGPELAAFGSADTIVERARALSQPPPPSSKRLVAGGYGVAWLAAFTASGSLSWASGLPVLAVTSPGLCVL